jgi:hypothetical protein
MLTCHLRGLWTIRCPTSARRQSPPSLKAQAALAAVGRCSNSRLKQQPTRRALVGQSVSVCGTETKLITGRYRPVRRYRVPVPVRAHDLKVAQLVSGTHLGSPGVDPILPNEVLAQTWANITLLAILFATFSQIHLFFRSTGSSKHAAGSGKRAESDRGRGARCRIALVSRYCTRKPWRQLEIGVVCLTDIHNVRTAEL